MTVNTQYLMMVANWVRNPHARWLFGAQVLMPWFLGMTQMGFVVGQMQWMSLVGHFLYGLVTAFAFIPLANRL